MPIEPFLFGLVVLALFVIVIAKGQKEASDKGTIVGGRVVPQVSDRETGVATPVVGQELPFPSKEYPAHYIVLEVDDDNEELTGNVIVTLPLGSEDVHIQRFATERQYADEAGFTISAKINDVVRTLTWDWGYEDRPCYDDYWPMNIKEIIVRFA